MLEYFVNNTDGEYDQLLQDAAIERMDADKKIEEAIKLKIVSGCSSDLDAFFGKDDPAVNSAVADFVSISRVKGIYIASLSTLDEGYRPLSPGQISGMELKTRASLLLSVLKIIRSLGEKNVYPGEITLDSIYINSSASDGLGKVLLGNVHHFQLGPFRRTWPQFLDVSLSLVSYPYVNDELQRSINVRLAAKILVCGSDELWDFDNRLEKSEYAERVAPIFDTETPPDIDELINMTANLAKGVRVLAGHRRRSAATRSNRIAVGLLIPNCSLPLMEETFYYQINLVKNAVQYAMAEMKAQKLELYEGYAWAGTSEDSFFGSGAVSVREFAAFDSVYYPNLYTASMESTNGAKKRNGSDHLVQACVAMDAMIRHLDSDTRVVLVVLHPSDNSQAINLVSRLISNLCAEKGNVSEVHLYTDQIGRSIGDSRQCFKTSDSKSVSDFFSYIKEQMLPEKK